MAESTDHIALVDDDQGVLRALGRLLRASGFCVDTYASAEAFLGQGDPGRFRCLILDAIMPGMNGYELCGRLRAEGCSVPIVMMTAGGRAVKGGAAGAPPEASAVLQKPFDDSVLMAAVSSACA